MIPRSGGVAVAALDDVGNANADDGCVGDEKVDRSHWEHSSGACGLEGFGTKCSAN